MHIATLLWWNQPHPEWLFIFCQYQHGFTNQKPKNLTSKIFINHLSISSDNCMKWGVHLWNMLCKKYTCPLVLNDQQFMWRIVALLYTKFWGKSQPDLYSIRFTSTWTRVYIQILASTHASFQLELQYLCKILSKFQVNIAWRGIITEPVFGWVWTRFFQSSLLQGVSDWQTNLIFWMYR